MRVQSAYLPVTDKWASDSIASGIRSQVSSQINQQYPNLPDENKNALISAEVQKILKEQKSVIEQQVEIMSGQLKEELQDESGQTYLLAIDPYFWMRHAKNIVEHGYPGDVKKDNVQWDMYMYAPLGRSMPGDMFHAYLEAYLYKFMRFFNRNLDLMKLAFYMPILISALAVIPAFFIGKRAGGNVGGLFASVMVAVHGAFLNRTAGGFADTDAYNVFFPLLITWLFIEAIETKEMKKKLTLGALSGFFVGLYSFTWSGWWYVFDFILGSVGVYLIYLVLVNRERILSNFAGFVKSNDFKKPLILLLVFFVTALVFVGLFTNFNTFQNFYRGPFTFTRLKLVAQTTVWPNVYTTVAEQNPSSLPGVISQIGGKFLFFLSLIGILFTMIKKGKGEFLFFSGAIIWYIFIIYSLPENLNTFLIFIAVPVVIKLFLAIKNKDTSIDMKYAALLILWFIGTIYASVKGVRYLLLLVPAFSIGFGIFVGIVYKYVNKWVTKELHVNEIITKTVVFGVLLLLLINPLKASYNTSLREIPSMNDAWYESLDKINREASPDAIINSWWDFGHWFKMIGNRAVTFDGTSQNTPMAHWVGKSFLTNDEKLAVGILRMLDCGSYKGVNELEKTIQNIPESIDITNEIIVLDKEDAKKKLKQHGLNDEQADAVLELTHCEPPENYYITSQDMIGKSGVWSHFGSWDFLRASMYNKVHDKNNFEGIKILKQEFNLSEEEADKIYYETQTQDPNQWISQWPSYQSSLSGCNVKEDLVSCGNGLLFNLTSEEAFISTQQGLMHPIAISIAGNEGVRRIDYRENTVPLGAALIGKENNYRSILMSPELTDSIFTRLFFFKGHGSQYFDLFSYQKSIFGDDIFVWKVDWDGKDKYLVDEFIVKTEVNEGDTVTVNYIGWLANGTVVDSTIAGWEDLGITKNTKLDGFNYQPFTYSTSKDKDMDIPLGFKSKIIGMKKGDIKTIIITPEIGYGENHPLANETVFVRLKVENIK